ncbi:MAG: transcriptional regulator, family protein [Clostridia bacterium]|jgi:hypothetical protein|nr:transcriptional regulator, family protein [Clostridia bacterium]
MSTTIKAYVDSVLEHIAADSKMKNRIEKDLTSHINEICSEGDLVEITNKMGSPEEVAKEFMENIYDSKEEIIDRLIEERAMNADKMKKYFEYKSKIMMLGLPLIHIKFTRGYGRRIAVAKGIIAIGDISIGALSIGGIALGGICIGGGAFGLISLGGLALGLLALGGVAIGGMALGGCALGLGAIGGAAFGKIAYGGFAKGVVAIGGRAAGNYVISGIDLGGGYYSLGYVSKQEIAELIRAAYPNIYEWVIKLFTAFGV